MSVVEGRRGTRTSGMSLRFTCEYHALNALLTCHRRCCIYPRRRPSPFERFTSELDALNRNSGPYLISGSASSCAQARISVTHWHNLRRLKPQMSTTLEVSTSQSIRSTIIGSRADGNAALTQTRPPGFCSLWPTTATPRASCMCPQTCSLQLCMSSSMRRSASLGQPAR